MFRFAKRTTPTRSAILGSFRRIHWDSLSYQVGVSVSLMVHDVPAILEQPKSWTSLQSQRCASRFWAWVWPISSRLHSKMPSEWNQMAQGHNLRTVLYRTIFGIVEQTFEFVLMESEWSCVLFDLYMFVELPLYISTKSHSWWLWLLIERMTERSTLIELVIRYVTWSIEP